MAFVRSCPELSVFYKNLILVAFHRAGIVRIVVRVVRYTDNGLCPKGAPDRVILSGFEAMI